MDVFLTTVAPSPTTELSTTYFLKFSVGPWLTISNSIALSLGSLLPDTVAGYLRAPWLGIVPCAQVSRLALSQTPLKVVPGYSILRYRVWLLPKWTPSQMLACHAGRFPVTTIPYKNCGFILHLGLPIYCPQGCRPAWLALLWGLSFPCPIRGGLEQ
jgi:hypothetical protein